MPQLRDNGGMTVIFGAQGVGLTSTVLHDVNGVVGQLAPILTIRSSG